ncbi:hypothetical protein V1477_011930 [Vespula maculifrons]|uniref:Uncharacterized protein n=1 Tax=Vespula maculifrons TaxID=7453 RepID=A0ABD2C0L3_VESMC
MFDIPRQKRFKFTFKNAPCCIVIDGTGVASIDKKSTSRCDELVRAIPGSRRAAGGQRVAERSFFFACG